MKIIPASELWSNQKDKAKFEISCDSVMKAILKASESGRRDCCFTPYYVELYDAVKDEFIKNGYRFKPTGRIGGVWQDTEQICW